jgi:hypothetical protein
MAVLPFVAAIVAWHEELGFEGSRVQGWRLD